MNGAFEIEHVAHFKAKQAADGSGDSDVPPFWTLTVVLLHGGW